MLCLIKKYLNNSKAEVALIKHDNFVLVRAFIKYMPAAHQNNTGHSIFCLYSSYCRLAAGLWKCGALRCTCLSVVAMFMSSKMSAGRQSRLSISTIHRRRSYLPRIQMWPIFKTSLSHRLPSIIYFPLFMIHLSCSAPLMHLWKC